MTKSEFMKKLAENPRWAPGWDAIEAEFGKVYPGVIPEHLGTVIAARAAFGGDQYLDGYSFYPMGDGCLHIVTFGLSELYGNKWAFGGKWSGKGCELTMKVTAGAAEDALWACDILSAAAKMACTQKRHLGPYQILMGDELGISAQTESSVRAVLLVPDSRIETIRTVYGIVQFLQLIGLTEEELKMLLSGETVEEAYKNELAGSIGQGVWGK